MKTDNCFHSLMHKYTMVYLPIQRRSSDKTVKTYKTALSQYRKYLLKEKNIPFSAVGFEHFKREQIYEFLTWMKDSEGLSESTVNLRLAAIKAFLRYCADEDIGLMSYYLDVKKINAFHSNKAITTIKYLNQDQLKSIFEEPDITKHLGRRDRFFMIFAYESGGRMQELLGVKLSDLIMSDNTIKVRFYGKGSKIRYIPIPDEITGHLMQYLKEFHEGMNSDDYLFYTIHDGRKTKMNQRTVNTFLSKYSEALHEKDPHFPKKLHEHMFRHSIGMAMYKAGIPLSYIRDFLGHSSVETTSIYAHADSEVIEKALASVNQKNEDTLSAALPKEKKWKDKEAELLAYCGLD